MVEKLKNTQDAQQVSAALNQQGKRKSVVELKVMIDTLNQVNNMVYGSGAANVADKLDPVKNKAILNRD
jgi:ribosomal protein L31E